MLIKAIGGLLLVSVAAPSPLLAASTQSGSSFAHIQYVEGEARLQRASEPEPEPGDLNVPIFPGDRLWTQAGSRAEVVLEDGTLLRLSQGAKLDFVALGAENVLRVWSGAVFLRMERSSAPARVDAPGGSVLADAEGSYRIDVDGDTLELAVYRGSADLATPELTERVAAGNASRATVGSPPERPYPFNTARLDEFDRFNERRDGSLASSPGVVVRSLPHAVQREIPLLSGYGTWSSHPNYGAVWYPTVGVGWAPYRYGRWCYTSYGYAWVSSEPWGWAPYHYGRWGHGGRGWYWIPGRTWGPAWVSFAFGGSWIGWSPLGYRDRPVYVFNQIVYDSYRRARPRGYRGDPRYDGGWNFVERHDFGRPSHGSPRLSAAAVGASGPARVLPSAAVLDRDLSPRAVGSVLRAAERRGGGSRFVEDTRRFARPAARYEATASPARTSTPRGATSSLPGRNVPRTAAPRARDAGAGSRSVVESPEGSRRAEPLGRSRVWTAPTRSRGVDVPTPSSSASPGPRAPADRTLGRERVLPRGSLPARVTPRSTPRRETPSATGREAAPRDTWTERPPSSRAPASRDVTPRSQPPRSAPARAVTPRSQPRRSPSSTGAGGARRGGAQRGASRQRSGSHREN